MRYKRLLKIAKKIDTQHRIKSSKIIQMLGRDAKFIGRGRYKRAFLVRSNKKQLILKVGAVYGDALPFIDMKGKRVTKFAKIYWMTKHCLLQKYCDKKVTWGAITEVRKAWKKAGYNDIKPANMGLLNGKITVFDAGLK